MNVILHRYSLLSKSEYSKIISLFVYLYYIGHLHNLQAIDGLIFLDGGFNETF